jgi:uridine kinase
MKIEVQNVKQCNQIVEMEKDESFYDLVKKMDKENYKKYLAVKVNNKLQELIVNSYNEDDKVKFLDLNDNDGQRIYIRTLCFIYIKACKDIFNFVDVNIEHSLNRGLYTEIKTKKTINQGDLKRIKDRMQEIIYKQMPINKKNIKYERSN